MRSPIRQLSWHRGPRSRSWPRRTLGAGLGASCLLIFTAAPGAAATFSVGTGCSHSTLAAAIFDSYLTAENDTIKVTQNLTNQNVVFDDFRQSVRGTVTVRGGYSSCADTTTSGRSVLDGITSQPIVRVQTTSQTLSTVILENLELRDAARGATVTTGGQLTLKNVVITENRDGGVLVDGGALVTDAATDISVNGWWIGSPAPIAGGGVSCSNSGLLDLRGEIVNNFAELGGGIALFSGCTATLQPGLMVIQNEAISNGGGIYTTTGTLVTGNGSANAILISANAAHRGGGLYVAGAGAVVLQDTQLSDNQAVVDGGAVYAYGGATVNLSRTLGCNPAPWPCNEMSDNGLADDDGLGSAVYADDASITIRRFDIERNQSDFPQFRVPLFYVSGANGELVLENLVIAGNRATNLVQAVAGATVFGGYLSSANNSYQSGSTLPSAITLGDNGTTAGFYSSILWDHQAFLFSGGSPSLVVDCLLTNSTAGVPVGADGVFTQNPQFVSPSTGDLRIGPSSSAVDFCDEEVYPDPGAPDIDGNSRPVDRPDNPNGSPGIPGGTFDVGAHEVQAGLLPLVFADGFEIGNVSAWSSSAGG